MCHLILLLPIIALPVFWLWPWPIALAVYAAVLVVSGWLYYYLMLAMRRPIVTGVEHTLHSRGIVIDDTPGALRVRVNSENWAAECAQPVHKGEPVAIVGHNGLTLRIQVVSPESVSAAAASRVGHPNPH